ncbi:MAG TPA: hypothetical protein EYG94_07830 [Campylobacterales bacterium]|nr:hypothetical protein [Campylobacterales bacterium]
MKYLLLTILLSSFAFSNISVESKNNKFSKVSHKELINLYLKKSNTINGIEVIPVDSQNKKLFQEFYQKVIKKNPKQLHAYWIKEIYRGNKQPPKKLSPKALKQATKNKTPIVSYKKNPKTGQILLTIK